MGILTENVEVKPTGKMIQYYKDKGYDAKHNKPLIVNVEDLPKNSHIRLEVLCDMCKDEIMFVSYQEYNISVEKSGSYVCKRCSPEKVKQNNLKKYGVSNIQQLEDIKNKKRNTILQKYGVEYYAQTKEYRDKMEATMMDRYGVTSASRIDGYREKYRNTCVERYGEEYGKHFSEIALNTFRERTGYLYPLQDPSIKEKRTKTNISKYGVSNPAKSPEVKEKISKTLYKNSSQKTSKQQLYIFNLYKMTSDMVELNYPVSYYSADICFPEEKLDIEYDGGFHNGQVKTGKLTQEEFDQKEIVRNNIIKRAGYKTMRIVSRKDKLPQDDILLQMLSDVRVYFTQYPNHSWFEFNLDTSTIRNAENPHGIPYDFGSLRTIKDSDFEIAV